jgi:hypothetical protein
MPRQLFGGGIMSMKKTLLGTLAGFVVLVVGRYLLHGVMLASTYAELGDLMRAPADFMHRMWAVQLANLLFAVAATLIYARGVESKPWLGQGIRFGILVAMATAAPQFLIEYAVYPIGHRLAFHWIVGEGVIAILMCLAIAAVCQPEKK